MAVNLSAGQLRPGLVETVAEALDESALAASCLTLEITESLLMDESAESLGYLAQLKALGVRLAIDDFGTGYSSLGRLRSLPIDELKIDRSFVADIAPDTTSGALVTAVTAMGRALGLEVVAEGVETFEQLRFLLGRGCDAVQGYLVGRPVPASTIRRLLTDPGSDLGVGGSLEVVDEPVREVLDAELADLLAGAASADAEGDPLVQSLRVRLDQATPSESS